MTKRRRVTAGIVVVALILVAVALVALLKGEETPGRGSSQMMRSGRTVRPKPADLEEADPRGPAVPSHTGITVLAADGAPVGSAVVTFRAIRGIRIGPEDLDTPLGVTDADGTIPWPETPLAFPGFIKASHPEHSPAQVVAPSRVEELVIRLGARSGISIRGAVASRDGRPISGAEVVGTFVPDSHELGNGLGVAGGWTAKAKSKPDGTFELGGLPPAMFGVISARAEGYCETRIRWVATERGPLTIVLAPVSRTVVRARDPSGSAVEGAEVWLFQSTDVPPVAGLPGRRPARLADEGGGVYAVRDLPVGWYSLLVVREGYRAVLRNDVGVGGGDAIDVTLQPVRGISGRVVSGATGEPVAGATVRGMPCTPDPSSPFSVGFLNSVRKMLSDVSAVTADDGTFVLSTVGNGDHAMLIVEAPDFCPTILTPRPLEEARLQRLLVWPLRALRGVGRVLDHERKPLPGAIVQGEEATTVTGEDGRFQFEAHQIGRSLTVSAPGHLPRRIGGGDQPEIDFGDIVLVRGVEVRVEVVDGAGARLAGIPLFASVRDAVELPSGVDFSGCAAVTNEGGYARFRVAAGAVYVVRALTKSYTGTVEVPGSPAEVRRLVLTHTGQSGVGGIRGRVRMDRGSLGALPLTVEATLDGASRATSRVERVDPDGYFEIPSVRSGKWTVNLRTNDRVFAEPVSATVRAGEFVQVEIRCEAELVGEDSPTADFVVLLEGGTAVEGASSASVWATASDGSRSTALSAARDGSWRRALPTNKRYAVWVFENGSMKSATQVVEHRSGAEAVVVRLTPGGRLALPPLQAGTRRRWVRVQDAEGRIFYSGWETDLKAVVADVGYTLVLPPGNFKVEVSIGTDRRNPARHRATVTRGELNRLK